MKPALTQFFLESVLPLLLTALGGALVWAVAQLASWLRSKAAESKLARVGTVVADLAASVVAELNATLRPQLQAALADGQLTDVEKALLKATAVSVLKTKLPPAMQSLAASVFGSAVDTWLAGHVERAVTAAKLPASVPLLPPLGVASPSPAP